MYEWNSIDSAPENVTVMTKIDEAGNVRNEQPMMRRGNLWWINVGGSGEMYVYYTPTHWRKIG